MFQWPPQLQQAPELLRPVPHEDVVAGGATREDFGVFGAADERGKEDFGLVGTGEASANGAGAVVEDYGGGGKGIGGHDCMGLECIVLRIDWIALEMEGVAQLALVALAFVELVGRSARVLDGNHSGRLCAKSSTRNTSI